jgi:predicted metal-dependent hydrolase
MWLLFGKPGFVRAALLTMLAYYRPGYSGDRAGDGELVRRGREALTAELGAGAATGAVRLRPARAAA